MKEIDRKRVPTKDQRKLSSKPIKQDHRSVEKKDTRSLRPKDNVKARSTESESTKLVSDLIVNLGTESSEVFEDVVIDYKDDSRNKSNEPSLLIEMVVDKDVKSESNGCSSDMELESKEGIDEVSDSDTVNDSASSHGDSVIADDEKIEQASKTPKVMDNGIKNVESSSKPALENTEVNHKILDSKNEDDVLDQIITVTNDLIINQREDNNKLDEKEEDNVNQKIVEMENRIEKLEQELREVAALEIALYSVVPEHGSSAHKVHTPSRRLCRLYIHACKHMSSNNRATIAKNTVSGLVLIAKSCGNDVPRLSFWLSNTVVLREIICQAFGISYQENSTTNEDEMRFTSLKEKRMTGNIKRGDWQETRTFTDALENVESWIFSRIVESIWWQTLTPSMQSVSSDSVTNNMPGRILGPSLGDQKQGSFCINLWINAFHDAIKRLCPVRGEGHECGCLPVLARKVMGQCLARLDVAMFNAILRESVHEIPTDPVSDPIVDSRVLPIPAGDLSFGSGAQLKNCVGNWTRWLDNMLGSGYKDPEKDDQNRNKDDDKLIGDDHQDINFILLNSLSDLLMLPKDMLLDKSVRMEVCPQISLPLVKRILCNFTPDEFCPDSVTGAVLEALNAEYIIEHHTASKDSTRSFPYSATPVEYTPPSVADVATKIAEVGGQSQLSRNVSTIQRKGYTSDEDLEELGSPLETIMQKVKKQHYYYYYDSSNLRYELLRQVWST